MYIYISRTLLFYLTKSLCSVCVLTRGGWGEQWGSHACILIASRQNQPVRNLSVKQ